jgi:hypothetical protein
MQHDVEHELAALGAQHDSPVYESGLAMNAIEDSLELHPRAWGGGLCLGKPSSITPAPDAFEQREPSAARARETATRPRDAPAVTGGQLSSTFLSSTHRFGGGPQKIWRA